MADHAWVVVKVGGSLFDLPDLRGRLRAWLSTLDSPKVLLVPGGGAAAEAVRELDRVHQLGEEASHWLAIQALSVNARFLHALLPETQAICTADSLACASGSVCPWYILDALTFFRDDERRPDHLPHCWQVTSDSLAVRAATVLKARELILFKSVAWEGGDWLEAARLGIVDEYFAHALRQSPALNVRVINLRGG